MADKRELAGRDLTAAAYQLLRRDRTMLALVFAGGAAATAAFFLVALPVGAWTNEVPAPRADSVGGWVAYAAGLFVASFVWVVVTGALFAAATMRAEGRDPTVRVVLGAAWARRGPLLAWALLSTLVGLALTALERLGGAGWVLRLLSGVAWAAATLFVVPVVMTEGTRPVESVRRSSRLLLARFGANVRATVRLGVTWGIVIGAAAFLACGGAAATKIAWHGEVTAPVVVGAVIAVVGAVLAITAITVASAVDVYLRTVLYRYATGRPTPGIDSATLPAFAEPA